MKFFVRFFVILLFLFSLSSKSHATTAPPITTQNISLHHPNLGTLSDLVIEGKEVIYDHKNSNFHATGDVQIYYRGTTLNTEVFHYSVSSKSIIIPQRFFVSRDKRRLQGDTFLYDMSTKMGTANAIKAAILPWYIKGEKLTISPSSLKITNAEFTTCGLEDTHKHYNIRSKKIEIYPLLGLLVAYDNQLDLPILPFPVPFPTFIYGNSSASLFSFNTPIPILGSSTREGSYIKQKIPYFITPLSTGDIEIGWLSRLGYTTGVTHRLKLGIQESATVMASWLGKDGVGGGLIYEWALPKSPSDSQGLASTHLDWMSAMAPAFSSGEDSNFGKGVLHLNYGQLIEDSRVDRQPDLEFFIFPWKLGDTALKASQRISLGIIQEHPFSGPNVFASRLSLAADVGQEFPVFPGALGSIGISNNYRLYEFTRIWERLHLQLGLRFETFLNPNFTFSKRLYGTGSSPFVFESRYAVEYDEVGINSSQKWGDLELNFDGRYVIDTKSFVTSDLSLGYVIHCWKLVGKWQTLLGNFNLGVELL